MYNITMFNINRELVVRTTKGETGRGGNGESQQDQNRAKSMEIYK